MMNSFEISKRVLNFAREKYRIFITEAKESHNNKGKNKKIDKASVVCNLKWPICYYSLENSKSSKQEIDFFIYRQGYPNNILLHEDYFDDKEDFKPGRKKINVFNNTKENLVIGRSEHTCVPDEHEEKENNCLEKKVKKISFEQSNNSGINNFNLFFNENVTDSGGSQKKSPIIMKKNEILIKKSKSCVTSRNNSLEHENLAQRKVLSTDLGVGTFNDGDVKIDLEIFPRLNKIKNLENFKRLAHSKNIGFLKSLVLIRKDSVILNKIPNNVNFDKEKEGFEFFDF